ncbi:hypothetical protein Forpe1208_v000680 [Fusarium oxysporum f. sp. rapae]|uniref:Uncharacterized protein n=1 Tax=Fusarium oxysporum f. sp. rapae TaxID=485398 RepID=A0A8J5TZG7_FUSOX|nr:hypothetical protein Forpe1208_v000680 [Fusarium oxysporum f. sp. rapae]
MNLKEEGHSRLHMQGWVPHTAAAVRYPHHTHASMSLVDVSSPGGGQGQHGNTHAQGLGNAADPLAMTEFLRTQEGRVNEFLQVSDRRAEAQRSALQQATDHLSNIASNIGANVTQWLKHPATKQGSDLNQNLQKAYKQLVDVDTQHRQLKLEHEALKKQLHEANAKVDEAVKERDELRRLADGANWTGSNTTSAGFAPEVDNPSRPGPTLRHIARWFAQGTALFGHFFGRDQNAFRHEAHSEVERLKLFCNIDADKSGTDFQQEIKAILEAALDLDEMLMSSRAIFLVRWPQDEQSKILQRFDANQMDSLAHTNELSSKTIVRFFISPMLIKVGNADGFNCDREMTLCKVTVACE